MAALDVGVASPAAGGAGDDAAEAMWRRKVNEREPVRGELEQAGICYKPFVFTCYGRPHAAASAAIRHISKLAGRRKGWAAKAVERQFRANIATALARRLARMSISTWPTSEADARVMVPIIKQPVHDAGDAVPFVVGSTSVAIPAARDIRLSAQLPYVSTRSYSSCMYFCS